MKTKNIFRFVLIFNFIFLFFNSLGYSDDSQGYAQAESPPAVLSEVPQASKTTVVGQTTNEPTNQRTNEPTELVTLDYKDAELSSVLRALSYSYNLNLVATKDIKGKVTVALRDVTVDEALNAVLKVNGYTFTRKGNLIYITPGPGLEGIDVVTVTIPLKYLTASEASGLLQKAISSKGDIRINEATNSLVLTDFPSSIEKVKLVLKDIDIPPIQVLIEAKLVDITEKDYQNFGVTYTVDYKPAGDIKGLFDRKTRYQEELAGSQTMAGPSSTLSGGQLKITTLTFKGLSGTVTLDALIQDQKAHLLASPSIATLNGKEARIIIGERYPYKEKTQTTTGTTETTKFVDIGTTLRVTPQVSPDGWITMSVHPEVSSLTSSLDAGPRIATREADATIRVRDGETIIIGGLIKRQDDRVKGRVPIIGHIPILGWLFTKASSDLTSTELVVFITPRIIRTPEEMKVIEATRQREVAVNIELTGERVVVNQLWEEARDLEKDEGLISRRKDKETRMSEALDRYKQLAQQFPGNEKADGALFRAGLIAYDYFADLDLAKKVFSQLIERYPDSPYVGKSRRMVEHINKKLADLEKRKALQLIPEQKKPAVRRLRSEDREITGNKGIIQGGQ
jgi:type II secretory pathway component GspD/PulD (secretin)